MQRARFDYLQERAKDVRTLHGQCFPASYYRVAPKNTVSRPRPGPHN